MDTLISFFFIFKPIFITHKADPKTLFWKLKRRLLLVDKALINKIAQWIEL